MARRTAEADTVSRLSPERTRRSGPWTPTRTLVVLALSAVVASAFFLTYGVKGSWSFALELRATTLATMAVVAAAIGISTVLFQTVTHNRILTPSIMGFDALYVAIQTILVAALGISGSLALSETTQFVGNVVVMVALSALLFRWLFLGGRHTLHVLVLVGVVLGVLFRSLSGFVQRLMDPNEFAVLQDRFFATFTRTDPTLLALSAAVLAVVGVVVWRLLPTLDVLCLGRDAAVSLGVEYRRVVTVILVLVAVLVSASTALVGPVTFFGLLVANLAYHLTGTNRHRFTLPAAVLLGVVALVGGQAVLQHVFGLDTALSVIIEFVGGIFFIGLLARGAKT